MSFGAITLDKNQFLSLAQKISKSKLLINRSINKDNTNNNKTNGNNLIYSNFLPNKERSRSLNLLVSNLIKKDSTREISGENDKELRKKSLNEYENNINNKNEGNNNKKTHESNRNSKQGNLPIYLSDSFSNVMKNKSYLTRHIYKKNQNSLKTESNMLHKSLPLNNSYNTDSSITSNNNNNSKDKDNCYRNYIYNNLYDNNYCNSEPSYLEKTNNDSKNVISNPIKSNVISDYYSKEDNNYKMKKQKNSFLKSIALNKINNSNSNNIIKNMILRQSDNSKNNSINNSSNTSKISNSNTSTSINFNRTNVQEKEKKIDLKYKIIENKRNIIIQLEELIILEEKISNISNSFKNENPHYNSCVEWWICYIYISFEDKFICFFNKETNKSEYDIAYETTILELFSIILIYEILKNSSITRSMLDSLKKLSYEIHQNYLIICNYILSSINIKNNSDIWINKLYKVISSKLKYNINNKNENIIQLKKGNKEITQIINSIFKLSQSRNKANNSLLNNYFKKINSLSINILNEYFRKKINEDNNISNELPNERKEVKIPYLKKKIPNGKNFTLVLDLDDTLINYKIDEKGRGILTKRPNLNFFLNEMSKIFEMIIFTAGTQFYADQMINIIEEKRKIFDMRLYRQHTIKIDNFFVKDLSKLGRDLSKVIIIDNIPQSFKLQKENGIYIKKFNVDNKNDNALNHLIPILKKITSNINNDVRIELEKFKNEIFSKITINFQE